MTFWVKSNLTSKLPVSLLQEINNHQRVMSIYTASQAWLLHGLRPLHVLIYLDCITVPTVSQSQPSGRMLIQAAECISAFNVDLVHLLLYINVLIGDWKYSQCKALVHSVLSGVESHNVYFPWWSFTTVFIVKMTVEWVCGKWCAFQIAVTNVAFIYKRCFHTFAVESLVQYERIWNNLLHMFF